MRFPLRYARALINNTIGSEEWCVILQNSSKPLHLHYAGMTTISEAYFVAIIITPFWDIQIYR